MPVRLCCTEQTDQKLGAEVTWSSRGEVKAWSVLSHILRPSPGRVVIPNIANLACEGQVCMVVLDKIVGNPLQTVQSILCLSSCSVALQLQR